MFVFFTNNSDVKRKLFGKKVKRHCPKCNRDATFYECDVNRSIKVMGVFGIWDKNEQVMQCGECLALYKTDEGINADGAKSAESGPDPSKQQEAEEKRREEEEKKLAEAERRKAEEQARAEAEERARMALERKAREQAVDAELEELKKKMGK